MTSTATVRRLQSGDHDAASLPLVPLTLMACTGFIVIMTETLPAGLLPQISAGLGVSEASAGQLTSSYALGSVLAAIPAISLTRGARRKPLLIGSLIGFLAANLVTAAAPALVIALLSRLLAGAFAGLLWGMLAGYARRLVAPGSSGRALAIAMTGTPVALALGTPLGSLLGSSVGWRWPFIGMSALSAIVAGLAWALVPDAAGQPHAGRKPLASVVRIPGVAPILLVVFTWMLAHNLLYTYIAPFLHRSGLDLGPDLALFVFGIAALAGVWITGALVARALRRLTLTSISLFVICGALLSSDPASLWVTLGALLVWGSGFGGAATQLQSAIALAASTDADVANAMLTTSFNLAILGGGTLGALIIDNAGATALPETVAGLCIIALMIVVMNRRAAFPR